MPEMKTTLLCGKNQGLWRQDGKKNAPCGCMMRHNSNLLEKCLTVVHYAVSTSSWVLAASSSPASCS
ncbi:hypothetical protein ACLK1Y_02485 [Escherichia coli]